MPREVSFRRAPFPLPNPGLAITGVHSNLVSVAIQFSGAVVWNGVDTPTEFKAVTEDGFLDSCITVLSTGSDWIEVEFNAGVEVGAAWELQGPMAGITPAVAWPQAGTVA